MSGGFDVGSHVKVSATWSRRHGQRGVIERRIVGPWRAVTFEDGIRLSYMTTELTYDDEHDGSELPHCKNRRQA